MILEYKDIPIFYKDQGQGNVVVLLHGFLETSIMWKNLISEIDNTHRVIAIDLLGHGQTGCLGYIHTMEMMAEAVGFVLDYLKIKTAILIGHSMGGYVALAFAEAHPEKVERLCLVNSTPFSDSPERQINRDRAVRAVKQNHKNFIRMSIANLFSVDHREQFVEEIEFIKMVAMKLPVQGIVAALEGMKIRKDRSGILKNSDVPKLVILGHQDPVLEYDTVLPQLKGLGVEIVAFVGGHMSYIENIKEFTYKVKLFIEN
ncbi:pimeloyl-ACP methyl ester carboxylesterase [Gelidibacter algens]|uniref:Pimeloyl-ACP methyl ester carboxylesterase n=1 Tax=Gelidibacter algens TaxID=49280 RepID=A0A1A7R1A0_9FLAO|nr:alpha/beta hydrolase [Gelidibacter algens]OBX25298.1 alpha/beta hydrolase [Gelidibacter algens]RAJ25802.1 pimeloyl-ACP methyl ester carboxylesterase [Gelidibacter algens]